MSGLPFGVSILRSLKSNVSDAMVDQVTIDSAIGALLEVSYLEDHVVYDTQMTD